MTPVRKERKEGEDLRSGEEGAIIQPKDFPSIHLSVQKYAVLTGWKNKVPLPRSRQAKAFKFKPDEEIQKMCPPRLLGVVEDQISGMGRERKVSPPWSGILWMVESQQRMKTNHRTSLALASQPNTPAWPDRKASSDMPPGSVYLLRLFPGLVSFQKDLDQRQEDGHSHRQEKWDIDSKLLVIGEIQEVEERGIKKGTLRRCHGFLAGREGG